MVSFIFPDYITFRRMGCLGSQRKEANHSLSAAGRIPLISLASFPSFLFDRLVVMELLLNRWVVVLATAV